MKKTKKNIKEAVRAFLHEKNLTTLCRNLRHMGVTKRKDVLVCLRMSYKDKTIQRMTGHGAFYWAYIKLSGDLDVVFEPTDYTSMGDFDFIKEQRTHPINYLKVLIAGDSNIYWASPVYQHDDYNKSVWRPKTADNVKKAAVINAYLLKDIELEDMGVIIAKERR